MHVHSPDSNFFRSVIPVSINGSYYTRQAFVDQINKGYQSAAFNGHQHNVGHNLHGYTLRNLHQKWHKPALIIAYDELSPSEYNGINRWQSSFDYFLPELNDRFGVKNYLNDVLVRHLNQNIKRLGVDQSVYCETYKDYLFACLKCDYAPPLDIRWSKQKGWGVYARADLFPFTFIGLYTGQFKFTLAAGIAERLRRQHNKYIWLMTQNTWFCVDAQNFGNYTRFINHDDHQSKRVVTFSLQIAQGKDRVSIPHNGFMLGYNPDHATNAVFETGEEVVWDYGPAYKFD